MCPHAHVFGDKKIRCALVHDHVLLRQGLRRLIEDEPDIEVVAEAATANEALRKVFEQQPEVVITDAHIFECEPDQTEQMIQHETPNTKVLFLSPHNGDGGTIPATGQELSYVMRQTSAAELLEMVRTTAATAETTERKSRRRNFAEWPLEDLLPRQRVLTTRERQVLKLLAEGRTVRSAAGILGLSVKTVDAHKFNLMRKLGIHNKAELVMWAIQKRVVALPVNL